MKHLWDGRRLEKDLQTCHRNQRKRSIRVREGDNFLGRENLDTNVFSAPECEPPYGS